MKRIELLQQVLGTTENSGKYEEVKALAEYQGVYPDIHVGKSNLSADEKIEWLIGQLLVAEEGIAGYEVSNNRFATIASYHAARNMAKKHLSNVSRDNTGRLLPPV